jgi:hypothetical protein
MCWWELVEMLRRFVLVGIMVLAQGSMRQLILGTIVATIFLLFQVQAAPYISLSDDFLASAASFSLVVVFLCSSAFKNAALTGLGDIQEHMSKEQKELYVLDPVVVTFIMVSSVLGAVLVSLVLFVVQIGVEGARLRHEALTSNARRLRHRKGEEVVAAPSIDVGGYHVFLSHVWGTGQDQMRIVKQRLLELIPNLSVFLDVDDLEDISDLSGYIERTQSVLVFCSNGYFQSKNCMIELRSSVVKKKPILALVDSDASRGGLTQDLVRLQLLEAEKSYTKWSFDDDPRAEELFATLFADEPVEWNRLGVFQAVTLRLIAERVLRDALVALNRASSSLTSSSPNQADTGGTYYVHGELANKKLPPLRSPSHASGYHVYCSPGNAGAVELIEEVATKFAMQPRVTRSIDDIGICDYMLVYLTALTWTSGEVSAAFGEEVKRAMNAGVKILLAHEMTGCGGQEARHGCEFSQFFACQDGATPGHLLRVGIYNTIAVALKGGEWRNTSMVLLMEALAPDVKNAAPEPDKVKGRMLRRTVPGVAGLYSRAGLSQLKLGANRAAGASRPPTAEVNPTNEGV